MMSDRTGQLERFRSDLYRCMTRWSDALFELCDATLCSPSPVASVPLLSLEPVFRRGHGSLYRALADGDIDECLRPELTWTGATPSDHGWLGLDTIVA